jgi:hypothetical protein
LLGAIVCLLYGDLSLTRLALLLGLPLHGLLLSLYFGLPLLLGLSLHSGLSLLFHRVWRPQPVAISLHLLFQSRLLGRVLVLRQASSQVGIFGHFTYENRRGRESNPRIDSPWV